MQIKYTKHALEKLKRTDIRKFGVNKKIIENAIFNPKIKTTTKYGDYASIHDLTNDHDIRVIYVIINKEIKVITFHIARKGRYL